MAEELVAAYWKVKAGSEEEFVARWRSFITWTRENAPGARSFNLLHNENDPQYFISHGSWADAESRDAWYEMPGFQEHYAHVRELVEDHVGGGHTLELSLTPVS
jgi:heme-degrading monooxygenase HmoA